jgi:HEAT repeat protein
LAASVFGADVGDLIKQLKDPDNDTRRAAVRSLAEAGADAKPAVPALVQALKDKDMFVRRFAAQALGEVGAEPRDAVPALRAALDDRRKEVQEAAATALGKMGGAAVDALVGVVKDSGKETDVRRRAVEALGAMGAEARPAVPVLTEALKVAAPGKKKKGPDYSDVRVAAATALGGIASADDKAVLDALTALTDRKVNRDRNLQRAAREAMQKIRNGK